MSATIHQTHNYADFVIFYKYVDGEPAMVLGGKRFDRRKAYIIPLSCAWQYADAETGAPTDYLVALAVKIGDLLGLGADSKTAYRIGSAIVDALPDLIAMPPKQPMTEKEFQAKAATDELVVHSDGKEVFSA